MTWVYTCTLTWVSSALTPMSKHTWMSSVLTPMSEHNTHYMYKLYASRRKRRDGEGAIEAEGERRVRRPCRGRRAHGVGDAPHLRAQGAVLGPRAASRRRLGGDSDGGGSDGGVSAVQAADLVERLLHLQLLRRAHPEREKGGMLSATCKAWPLSEARSRVRRAGQGTTGRFGMHRVCGHRRAQARRDGSSARDQPAALPHRRSLEVRTRLTSRPRRSPEAPLTSPARSGRP